MRKMLRPYEPYTMGNMPWNYELYKARCPSADYPFGTAVMRYREHMENEHGAAPKDYRNNVLGWHKKNHPTCETLPSFKEASRV